MSSIFSLQFLQQTFFTATVLSMLLCTDLLHHFTAHFTDMDQAVYTLGYIM